MAIDWDTANTGLFSRLGALAYLTRLVNGWRAVSTTADTLDKEVNDVVEMFDGEPNDVRETVLGLLDGLADQRLGFSSIMGAISDAAAAILIKTVDDEYPLTERTVEAAINMLIAAQFADSETVDANEPSSSFATAANLYGNAGTGNLLVSLKNGRGETLQHVRQETIACVVTDATTAGREIWSVAGEEDRTSGDTMHWLHPSGSGADLTIRSSRANGADNILTNGDFEAFTGNAPDDWDIITGAATTEIDDSTANAYVGTNCLQLIGGTGTLTQIRQLITVEPRTLYALNFWIKADSAPASGAMAFDLYDGSAVIQDEAGTNCSLSVTLSSLTSSYAAYSAVFIVPDPLPSTVYFRIRVTTAIPASREIFIDEMTLKPMTAVYDGGPSLAFFTGANQWTLDDTISLAITNDLRGAFQAQFDQWFDMRNLGSDGFGLQLKSVTGGTETIADSLIA